MKQSKKLGLLDLLAAVAVVLGTLAAIGGIAVAPATTTDSSFLVGGFAVAVLGGARLSRFFRI